MKCLIVILLALSSAIVSAENLGRELGFYNLQNKPQFGVIYSSQAEEGNQGPSWLVNFTVNAGLMTQNQPVKTLAWRLWEKANQEFLTDWQVTVKNGKTYYNGLMAFSWALTGQPAWIAFAHTSNLMLVISLNQDEAKLSATHFIDLGQYCASHPKQFVELDSESSACK